MPSLSGDSCFATEIFEDVMQALSAMWWQFQGLLESVHHPAQDHLSGAQVCVAFEEFLHGRDMFASGWIVGIQGAEHSINGVQ